ncbi:hypothetical protein PRIPAC_97234 [Pristionchus pacificus]|uniref:Uncharacterized protein n=1 Tax=Pristionchus pacificus TaxID=54126 RepID=A0A2A6B2K3_PRIPA|nr:hypothetical protein PRIPAC_97234 [Pristionchus pacificus]|eukprot:PDM60105.1 hypothetical protein PRIPAC_49391 [Pristionchus pacificus]
MGESEQGLVRCLVEYLPFSLGYPHFTLIFSLRSLRFGFRTVFARHIIDTAAVIMEQGKNYRCKLCPALLFESGAALHFQRVHDRQYGRVVLWKCTECGLEATMAEQQNNHDDAVKEKKITCFRRARLNEQFFQKIGPISCSRRNPSSSLDRPLPDSLPKFFEALQIVKQNSLANRPIDEEASEDCLMVPVEDEGRPRSAPPPILHFKQEIVATVPNPRFNYRNLQRGEDEQVSCASNDGHIVDQGSISRIDRERKVNQGCYQN